MDADLKSLTALNATYIRSVVLADADTIDTILGDEIGTIEPGKLADLTFLGSDPLLDIRNTRDVKRVMRGGRLFSVSDLLPRR